MEMNWSEMDHDENFALGWILGWVQASDSGYPHIISDPIWKVHVDQIQSGRCM